MKHFQVRNKYAVLYELQAKTKELAEQPLIPETADPDDIASALFDFRSNLKKLRDDSDELIMILNLALCFSSPRYRVFRKRSCFLTTPSSMGIPLTVRV